MSDIQTISQGNYLLSNLNAQKLYAQSPLTTGVSGTSAYIGIEPNAMYNETVLWSAATPAAVTSFVLSESANLFEKIEVHYQHVDPPYMSNVLLFDGNSSAISIYGFQNGDRTIWLSNTDYNTTNYINYTKQRSWNIGIGQSTESTQKQKISKIIGINRKENV